jgi:hypothetical protein
VNGVCLYAAFRQPAPPVRRWPTRRQAPRRLAPGGSSTPGSGVVSGSSREAGRRATRRRSMWESIGKEIADSRPDPVAPPGQRIAAAVRAMAALIRSNVLGRCHAGQGQGQGMGSRNTGHTSSERARAWRSGAVAAAYRRDERDATMMLSTMTSPPHGRRIRKPSSTAMRAANSDRTLPSAARRPYPWWTVGP